MTLEERLENVAVIGAAGKMGSGIVLLLAQEMALLKQKHPDRTYHLYAVDVSEEALDGLTAYLGAQATKAGEKRCIMLRDHYKDRQDLIENTDIIQAFTTDVLSVLRPTTTLESVKHATMVFEAIVEDVDVKKKVLGSIKSLCSDDTFFFTNTSSIPIHILDERIHLDGRIIGFHFYNPPAVQKLAELIPADSTRKEVVTLSHDIAKRLKKKIIPSNDVAGFIGNGHFMRDIMHASETVSRLTGNLTPVEAIYTVNKISQDFLIRPMGIFQLADYVGIEVCQLIMKVMSTYIDSESLQSDLVDKMVACSVFGGQYADGKQKDGFLKYEKNRPAGIYDIEQRKYIPLDSEGWTKNIDDKIGALPVEWAPWRSLLMDPKREAKLAAYFSSLRKTDSFGASLARDYMSKSKQIAEMLVKDGVANNPEDVNGVLTNGFYHLYGPVNTFME